MFVGQIENFLQYFEVEKTFQFLKLYCFLTHKKQQKATIFQNSEVFSISKCWIFFTIFRTNILYETPKTSLRSVFSVSSSWKTKDLEYNFYWNKNREIQFCLIYFAVPNYTYLILQKVILFLKLSFRKQIKFLKVLIVCSNLEQILL